MPMVDAGTAPISRGRVPSLTLRLAVAVSLILLAGGVAVTLAALAYGRQAAQEAYDRVLLGAANQIAAMPSLHSAFPALLAMISLHHFGRRGWPVPVYACLVFLAVTGLGEHYLVDVLTGVALAARSICR